MLKSGDKQKACPILQIFKALANGEEESVQPKRPKVEPQPRAPYVPKQPQVSGQKRQGKQSHQQGSKGKKQKKGEQEAVSTEEPAPLPPSDLPPSDDSAAEVDMEGVESAPPPPLPPPSPESASVHSAVANGYSSGQTDSHQALASELLPSPPAPPLTGGQSSPVALHSAAAPTGPPSRPQVGFKLQGSRRQKLKMVEAEDPTTIAMRERLQQHLASQQQSPQQQLQEQLEQQLEQQQQSQTSLLQHALAVPLPVSGLASEEMLRPPPAQQSPQQGSRSHHASRWEPMNAAIPGIHDATDAHVQPTSNGHPHLSQQRQSGRQHGSAKHKVPEEAHVETMPQQQQQIPQQQLPQQLPRQLPREQIELPPGLAPEPEQLQPQLQRSQSHRHVHHRRSSRRSHRAEAAALDTDRPSQEASQHMGSQLWHDQAVPQQSGYVTDPMLDPVIEGSNPEQGLPTTAVPGYCQYPSQTAQPAPLQSTQAGQRLMQAPVGGVESGLAGLAESGGPVALANGHAADAGAGLEVLADDVKSLLR